MIPCYNSELTIRNVVGEVIREVSKQEEYQYEIILVNDGSRDGTGDVIKQLAEENDNIAAVLFAKNFGHHAALMGGICNVMG